MRNFIKARNNRFLEILILNMDASRFVSWRSQCHGQSNGLYFPGKVVKDELSGPR